MKPNFWPSFKSKLFAQASRLEWVTFIVLLLVIIFFHSAVVRYSGGFFRDESSSLNLATRSFAVGIHNDLLYDSFPPISTIVFHTWSFISRSDVSFKILGFVIGMGVLASLWFTSRMLGLGVPLLALTLFGLNATVIRFGDAMRPYGLGMIFIFLAIGFVWKLVTEPNFSWKVFGLAVLTSVLSVQTMYQNSFLLFGICAGAVAVALSYHNWKKIWAISSVGLIAALSLAPYMGFIHHASAWSTVAQDAYNLNGIWPEIYSGLGSTAAIFVFILSVLLIYGVGFFCLWRGRGRISTGRRDLFFFSAVTLLVATPVFLAFLYKMRVPTQIYYFIPILGLAAICLEAIFMSLVSDTPLRKILKVLIAIIFLVVSAKTSLEFFRTRTANIDLIAGRLTEAAAKKDLIVVNPWQIGVSFNRYYRGPATWVTLPPLSDLSIFRYDLVKNVLNQPDPTDSVFNKINQTLKSGDAVWVVGESKVKVILPQASGTFMNPYIQYWSGQLSQYMDDHAQQRNEVDEGNASLINSYENFPLTVFHGWKE